MASPPYPHQPSSSLASSSASSFSSSIMPTPLLLLPPQLSYRSQAATGGSTWRSRGTADPPQIGRRMVGRWCPVLLPKARASRQTSLTSNERRAAFPFRAATGTGAAAAALRPPSCGLSVWVSPSYRGQISPARARRTRRLATSTTNCR